MDLLIMSRNNIVAKWQNKILEIANEALVPIYLGRTGDLEAWLESRAIDSHRANSRLLKKALRLTEKNDIETVISVHAACVTDTYWVKPLNSTLKYEDVVFDDDYFANLALKGNYDSFNRAANSKSSKTPELTNTGSFEKCWKLLNGEWWMYKKANHNEQFSELFAYEFGHALGMKMAEYRKGDKCVKTKDFTKNASVNFEPAHSFMGDNEDYIQTFNALKELSPKLIPDYVRMIYLDTLIANPDRHSFNYGILRDVQSGQVIGFAPNFDNNMALISRGYPKNIERKKDLLIQLFNQLTNYDPSIKEHLPTVTEDIIRVVIKKLNMKVKSQLIVDFILNAYRQII
jgi:hypothetical protein